MLDKILPVTDPRLVLDRLCRERGEDFAGLSKLIGRNPAYVQQFVRRGTPRRLPERERGLLARHFGVSEEVLGGPAATTMPNGMVRPQSLGSKEVGLAFDSGWLAQLSVAGGGVEALCLGSIDGDAMAPTFQRGDQVLVDTGDGAARLRDGLYVLRVEGDYVLRRLTVHPVRRAVTVQTDNPAHADWPDLSPDAIDIVGRLLWVGRRLS